MIKPYYDHAGITIYHGDCREIMPEFEPVDLVYTDPPYNAKKGYGVGRDDLPDGEYLQMMDGVYRLLLSRTEKLLTHIPKKYMIEFFNFLPRGQMIILKRSARGGLCRPWFWADQYDVLYAFGQPKHAPSNLWEGIRLKGEGYFFREETYGHFGYTPMPVAIRTIQYMTNSDSTVLDCYAGTGTTLVAAKELGRRAIGIEIEEKYCEIAVRRLAQEVLPFTPPSKRQKR